jgi:hypothetical protein
MPAPILEAFVDESCQTQHRYLVLGGLACKHENVSDCEARFAMVRKQYAMFGEVKWTKVSRAKLHVYKALVDTLFSLISEDKLHFHSLIADTSEFDHKTYNQGNSEIGFHKLIYQLLLHKFGRRYADEYRLYVYLDRRTTKASLMELRSMLNSGLAKSWDIRGWPVSRVHFRNSDSSDLFQLNDLLIGAIGHRKNQHYLLPNASVHKRELGEHIVAAAGVTDICRDTRREATRFTVWNFHYPKRGTQGPRP